MTKLKRFLSITTAALITLFAIPAFAQTVVEVNTTNAVEAGFTAQPLAKPLDAIKARAQQIKQNTMKGGVKFDAGVQMEPGRELKPMPPQGMMRERIASSTKLIRDVKLAVRQHAGLIRERFTNAMRHLTQIMTRIDTRIEKMKTAGVDVTAVESLQVSAETSIDTAETDIAAVKSYIESVDESAERATVKAELQVKIKKANDSIKAAHEAVRKVVKALVDLAKSNRSASVEVDASVETE